jgi:hypothetical protein
MGFNINRVTSQASKTAANTTVGSWYKMVLSRTPHMRAKL